MPNLKRISATGKSRILEAAKAYAANRDAFQFMYLIETVFDYEQQPVRRKDNKSSILTRSRRIKTPDEYTHEEHCERVKKVFSVTKMLDRPTMISRLRLVYEVGYNAIQDADGFLPFLQRNDYIGRAETRGLYQIGENAEIGGGS